MSTPTKAALAEAEEHARREYPREACGLIVSVGDSCAYHPCQNIATTPEEHFAIDPVDFARAEDKGEVIGVFHSHPNEGPEPSAADRSACTASGLTWHILSLPGAQWFTLDPASDTQAPLYGREFVHGSMDCYGFVHDWYLQELGIELGGAVREDEWWKKGQNLYLDNYESRGMVRVTDGSLQRGDVLLMQVLSNVPNHGAIYLGDNVIGHHLYGRLSCREVYGGYYKKHTTHVLRYKK